MENRRSDSAFARIRLQLGLPDVPDDPLGRTRYLLLAFALFAAAMMAPNIAFAHSGLPAIRVLAVALLPLLAFAYAHAYRRGHATAFTFAVELVALTAATVGAGEANRVLLLLYAGLYFRALYGSRNDVLATTGVYLFAYLVGAAVPRAADAPTLLSGHVAFQIVGLAAGARIMQLLARALSEANQTRALSKANAELTRRSTYVELMDGVAAIANASSDPEEAMSETLDRVRATTGWAIGQAFVVNGDALRRVAISSDDEERFRDFAGRTAALKFAGGEGLPGRVWASGDAAWVTDTETDTNFPRLAEGSAAGLSTGVAIPVKVGDDVVAVLEFFSETRVARDPLMLEVVAHVGAQLGRVCERKSAHETLLEERARYHLIVETAGDAFVEMNEQGEVTAWNRQAERTFGRSADAAIGRNLGQLIIPEELRAAHDAGLRRYLATGESRILFRSVQLTALHEDGHRFPVELHVWPIHTADGIRCNAFIQDISERKALEERLRLGERLESVGRLAGGVAHDFNNLLTAIRGFAELAHAETAPSDAAHGYTRQIQEASDRAAALTMQLLAFSRKQTLQPRAVDLNQVIGGIVEMLRPLIGEDTTLRVERADGLRAVIADPRQLEQVIVNLVVNARDADPGGTITLTTSDVEVGVDAPPPMAPGSYVRLEVADEGPGMDAETKAQIFEPFFTTKPRGEGTGLGLATVYGIVKQSGGYIWVDSEPGTGTRFEVYLPPTSAEAVDVATAPPVPASPGTGTILLVEDEDIVRSVTGDMLRSRGYDVVAVADVDEGLDHVRSEPGRFDLVISDIVMPGRGGGSLATDLAELAPDLPLVFVSGYDHDGLSESAVAAARFLRKPYTIDELAIVVREAIAPSAV